MGIRVYWVANVHMCIQYPSQRPHVDCSAELISSEMTPAPLLPLEITRGGHKWSLNVRVLMRPPAEEENYVKKKQKLAELSTLMCVDLRTTLRVRRSKKIWYRQACLMPTVK